ncbi:amidohydrolase [Flavobacterium sp. NST-5]|uniref:Amidohydrolase n=1 Tax=Flavobacterium ichthyis TaxID=2698827 RepID=A0ABW9Z7U2_9FLAO|nr:amidohydrolase [Flavobacterium ichthyis]NBL64943.1 amidohydrolase [Flavobacterium ichthyis]
MNITLIQTHLVWENPSANRKNFEDKIESVSPETDLIVLPETFATGFTMQPQNVAENPDGETVIWLQKMAAKKNAAIVGSLAIQENNRFYNRLYFVLPSGEITIYNKRHLFSLAGEDDIYTAGKEKVIVDYKGWKICLQVCYDLRFPVFARNTENYDLLLYVANWPDKRIQAWNILLKARAVENLCYVVGVNRFGKDDQGFEHSGHSQVLDFAGEEILPPQTTDGVFQIKIPKKPLLDFREKFNFLNDRDQFQIL